MSEAISPRIDLLRVFAIILVSTIGAFLLAGGDVMSALLISLVIMAVVDVCSAVLGAAGAPPPWARRGRQAIRLRHGLLFVLVILKVLWMARCIPPSAALDRPELFARRDYLVARVLRGSFGPEDSPAFFSSEMKEEWAIGTLSMLGAALANLSYEFPESRGEHRQMVKQLIQRMLGSDIRIYEKQWWGEDALQSLAGSNGHIGYLGHLNLLLGIYRLLGGGEEFAELHDGISSALARRILESPSRYLETFPGQIFIPDNAVVLASLRLYDSVRDHFKHEKPSRAAIDAWLEATRANLIDSETGLIMPWIRGGRGAGSPRGSYSTWNVFYLMQIDAGLAVQQSEQIRAHLLEHPLRRACAIREFLPSHSGAADVDSGPVILGLSTSGTGFGMAAARALGDEAMLHCLLVTGELVGSTYSDATGTRYLAAPLIGDAIVLAMRTGMPWDTRFLDVLTDHSADVSVPSRPRSSQD